MSVHRFHKCASPKCGHVWAIRAYVLPIRCPRCQKVRPLEATEEENIAYQELKPRKRIRRKTPRRKIARRKKA